MLSRRSGYALAFGVLAALFPVAVSAQAPKPKDVPKEAPKKEPEKQPAAPGVDVEDMAFKSADGVKLSGTFYKCSKGASGSCVILLSPYGTDTAAKWDDLAKQLQAKHNVFRFDFRGHGKSTEVVPGEFWLNAMNKQYAAGAGGNLANKTKINFKDFKPAYFPMLVQDIAAVRNQLDQLNDSALVNTSTIYLVGAGDTVGLGMLYLSSEWLRERSKPNVGVPPQLVTTRRNLFPGSEAAGTDFGGAIWLSPALPPTISRTSLRNWSLSPYAVNLRSETPMLMIYGKKDAKAENLSKYMYADVLVKKGGMTPAGKAPKDEERSTTAMRAIDSAGVGTGVHLLGENQGTEKLIDDYLSYAEAERKNRTRKNREWEKPLLIDVASFGAGQQ